MSRPRTRASRARFPWITVLLTVLLLGALGGRWSDERPSTAGRDGGDRGASKIWGAGGVRDLRSALQGTARRAPATRDAQPSVPRGDQAQPMQGAPEGSEAPEPAAPAVSVGSTPSGGGPAVEAAAGTASE